MLFFKDLGDPTKRQVGYRMNLRGTPKRVRIFDRVVIDKPTLGI